MAQGQVREEAAVRVAAMAMQNVRDTSEDLSRIVESAQPAQTIADPARGNFLDVEM